MFLVYDWRMPVVKKTAAVTPRTKFVSIRMTAQERHALKVRASQKGVAICEYLKTALDHYYKSGK